MFEVGFSEMLMIAFVALVVLGPEKLPKAARFAGLWIRRARAQWYSVKAELEREIAAEQLKSELHSTLSELKQDVQSVQSTLRIDPANENPADDAPALPPAEMVGKNDHGAP